MGTWGSGILQNDHAADSVLDAAGGIDEVIRELAASADPPSAAEAERMLGAVALLMRFTPYALAAENDERASVVAAITRLRSALPVVSAEANAALDAIVAGAEPDYRLTSFSPRLTRILHGNDDRDFPMQRTWADAPNGVFDLPGARAVAQEVAEACVAAIDDDFESEETLADPCRESFAIGHLALLLVLDGIRVDPACFARWRDAGTRVAWNPSPRRQSSFGSTTLRWRTLSPTESNDSRIER